MPDKESDNEMWINLCEYVKRDIMGYTDDMKLPKFIALRLRGLSKGQFIANKKQKAMANYDYQTILYTFKACKLDIMNGFKGNNTRFKNEQHRFNYALVVIENNINDMVLRLQKADKAKEKAETIEVENIYHEGAEYISRSKKSKNNLEDLW